MSAHANTSRARSSTSRASLWTNDPYPDPEKDIASLDASPDDVVERAKRHRAVVHAACL